MNLHGRKIVDSVQCPNCNGESKVIDSRDVYEARRRRRECLSCKKRYSTYEVHAEQYDRIKLVSLNTSLIDTIIKDLQAIKSQFGDADGSR